MTISFGDILGSNGDGWMSHPDRPCALPKLMPAKDKQDKADQWYPTEAQQVASARKLCTGCPAAVKNACLQYALDERIEWGIWGATTEEERRLMLKQAAA